VRNFASDGISNADISPEPVRSAADIVGAFCFQGESSHLDSKQYLSLIQTIRLVGGNTNSTPLNQGQSLSREQLNFKSLHTPHFPPLRRTGSKIKYHLL
jgi:hypothetical protein